MKRVQEEGCNQAITIADGLGFPLDFTPASIQTLDRLLGAFYDDYLKTKNDEGSDGLAVIFAAYLVEVIERNYGPGLGDAHRAKNEAALACSLAAIDRSRSPTVIHSWGTSSHGTACLSSRIAFGESLHFPLVRVSEIRGMIVFSPAENQSFQPSFSLSSNL